MQSPENEEEEIQEWMNAAMGDPNGFESLRTQIRKEVCDDILKAFPEKAVVGHVPGTNEDYWVARVNKKLDQCISAVLRVKGGENG